MKWDNIPDDVIKIILYHRKIVTCGKECVNKIIATWKCYKTRVLIGRFKMLRYLRDFRLFNPSIKIFLLKSKL